jgi:hypothetical protein
MQPHHNAFRTAFAMFVLTLGGAVLAQAPDAAAQREAMKKLEFLAGKWQGGGWMEFVPGQRTETTGTELVAFKAGGIVLAVEGLHHADINGNKTVVHDAFGIITFDPAKGSYRFQGFTARGNHEDVEAKVTEGQLVWAMKTPMGEMRFTIRLDEQGRWFEIGEMSSDGKEWRKFFEMTLTRVN